MDERPPFAPLHERKSAAGADADADANEAWMLAHTRTSWSGLEFGCSARKTLLSCWIFAALTLVVLILVAATQSMVGDEVAGSDGDISGGGSWWRVAAYLQGLTFGIMLFRWHLIGAYLAKFGMRESATAAQGCSALTLVLFGHGVFLLLLMWLQFGSSLGPAVPILLVAFLGFALCARILVMWVTTPIHIPQRDVRDLRGGVYALICVSAVLLVLALPTLFFNVSMARGFILAAVVCLHGADGLIGLQPAASLTTANIYRDDAVAQHS